MKFGLSLAYGPSAGAAFPEYAVRAARMAEELGFDSVWGGEHVAIPAGYTSVHPYSPEGRLPKEQEDAAIPDPLVWLAFLGSATSRLRLATGVVVIPQRHPLMLAKEVATLDLLTGGRVILGVGVGWMREESEALGVPFEDRAARADEYIAALRRIWSEPEATFRGRFATFERAKVFPKPAQPGGPPIVIGGHTLAAARRAGRLGDGFYPAVGSPEHLAPLLVEMRSAAREAGRDPDRIEVTVAQPPAGTESVPPETLDEVKRYADAGVSRMVLLRLFDFDLRVLERALGDFSEKVIARGLTEMGGTT